MKDKHTIIKQRSHIVAGTRMKEKLEDSEMKKDMTRKERLRRRG
jgi:hypothetical protein